VTVRTNSSLTLQLLCVQAYDPALSTMIVGDETYRHNFKPFILDIYTYPVYIIIVSLNILIFFKYIAKKQNKKKLEDRCIIRD
jgi:hypothetical protein